MNAARVKRFANGTEGGEWMSAWCYRCVHDHDWHTDAPNPEPACALMLRSLTEDESPLVWQPMEASYWRTLPAGIQCRAFEPCACDDDGAALMRLPRTSARPDLGETQ